MLKKDLKTAFVKNTPPNAPPQGVQLPGAALSLPGLVSAVRPLHCLLTGAGGSRPPGVPSSGGWAGGRLCQWGVRVGWGAGTSLPPFTTAPASLKCQQAGEGADSQASC